MTAASPDPKNPPRTLDELVERLGAWDLGLVEILDALAEAVTIRNQTGILHANRAAFESMGFSTLEEMLARGAGSIIEDYIVQDEEGRALTMADVPSVRQLAGEAGEPLLMRTVHRRTGEAKWELLKSTLLTDDSGEAIATVTIIEDVTGQKTAELREHFLVRATETLMSSLDYQETLSNVAWLAVPELADWCAVDLVDEHGQRQAVATAHRDPAKAELARRLRELEDDRLTPGSGLGRVLSTGEPLLLPTIPTEMLESSARGKEHLSLIRQLGARSALAVPMPGAERIIGAMTLLNAESGRRFSADDVSFALQIAARAAVAAENARIYSERSRIATTLQESLLPTALPE